MTPSIRGVRAALLDLDGTLVDSLGGITIALGDALEAHGRTLDVSHVARMAGYSFVDYFTRTLAIAQPEASAIYAAYLELYTREHVPLTRANPGADALLDTLDAAEIAMAIVTNKRMSVARSVLDVVGWRDRFRAVVAHDSVENAKPAPDAALLALDTLGVLPCEAVFVGDSESDMACGASAGCAAVIGVLEVRPADALRASGATHICHNLIEVRALLGV